MVTSVPNGVYDLSTRVAGSTTNAIVRTAVSFVAGRVYTIGARGVLVFLSVVTPNQPPVETPVPTTLVIIAILFALLALIGLVATIRALKQRKWLGAATAFTATLLMLVPAALFGTISIALQGYRALTREELAAVVVVQPTGVQQFTARFSFPDSTVRVFALAGDQLYVDAHILKWKPIANIFGLHTSYELDRVSGRYEKLQDERDSVRTVFTLSRNKPVDMFHLRRRFERLNPLVDAEYGSATFIGSDNSAEFGILVSTTGLLIRKIEKGTSPDDRAR